MADDTNISESSHQGFTKKVKSRAGAPTVVEFSLVPEVRTKLQKAFKSYVTGKKSDEQAMADIIRDPENFPAEILAELQQLSLQGGGSTIYVVHNLPEIPLEQIPKALQSVYQSDELGEWCVQNSYASFLGRAISVAAKLEPYGDFYPVNIRHSGDTAIQGGELHNHPPDVSTLNGIASRDRAATSFVDTKALFEEAANDKTVGDIKVKANGETIPGAPLNKIAARFQKSILSLSQLEPDDKSGRAAFDALLAKHAQDIVIKPGTMVLWPDNGHIFHRAMPGKAMEQPGEFVRAIIARFWSRPPAADCSR